MNSYFSTEKYKNYTFYRFPKFVITDKRYKNLSSNAKLLYGLILDKAGLSEKNYKHDKDGRIKVFFTNKQVCNLLNIGHNTVTKIFKELESYDLIDRSKQGFGQANITYPKLPFVPKEDKYDP